MGETADVAVIGSGPGGAVTACVLAEAGRDVLLLEEGPHLPLESCAPFGRDEMVQKYRHGGVTATLGSPKVAYVEARCVGGGSEVNSGLYHRTPDGVLEEWRRTCRVEALGPGDLRPHFEACERDLSVGLLPGEAPPASTRLALGASRLGWKALEVPRWYRYDRAADGTILPARQSMTRTYVPRALAAGARLLSGARVVSAARDGGWRLHVEGPEGPFDVRATTVFVAAGAIQTPALLLRSRLGLNVGARFGLHATIKVVARFDDLVTPPGAGVPVHQVKEFAPRISLGGSISAPPYLALALTDHPEHLDEALRDPGRCAVYYAMIRGGSGSVHALPFVRDPIVRYRLGSDDLFALGEALRALCRCLLAAGARELFPSIRGAAPVRSEADLARLPASVPPATTNLMTIHVFGSCPMGEAAGCVTDSQGRVHGEPGLHVADASLLCGPPGVNPQGTIMAIARRNALAFLEGGPA